MRPSRVVAIVDDDPGVARVFARQLAPLFYEPVFFTDAATAIAELPASGAELIVMDVMLGGRRDGFEVAAAVSESLDVPVLFLTGLERVDVPSLGACRTYAFLQKPVRQSEILTTIRLLERQHEAHLQLAASQRFLAESQRVARIGSFRLDDDECAWTDVMFEIHGVQRHEFTPSPRAWLELVFAEDRETCAKAVEEEWPERSTFEYRVVVAGQLRRLRGHSERRNERGRVSLIGTVQDVTEVERATEANRAKTEFLANMSHELRTPLNAMLGLSEAILEGTFGGITNPQRNVLSTIHTSGTHLLELINDMLDISRVELGHLTVTPAPISVRALVDEVAQILVSPMTTKRQRFVIDIAPALSTIEVDRKRFKQVLFNIIGNASKFSPVDSTITLRANADVARRRIQIAVSDEGPGIPESERARVLQPFVTLDSSLTRSNAGVGLGLSLAKRIVELHDGTIEVGTSLGGGTTITILLPLSEAMVEMHGTARRTVPTMEGRVILVAEDNEAIAFAIRSYLESLGCVVRLARDGLAALEAATKHDVDAIVMDVRLPELDGLSVTREIRARGHQQVPIVVVTAHAMPGDDVNCLEAGGNAYLPKPVSLRRLAETLDTLVRPS